MQVVGVDGTKGGWVGIELDDGRFTTSYALRPIATDFQEVADALVIAIDIPIGFGPRKADAEVRAFLRGAASTVFTTPRREVLEMKFGPGLGVSAQSHALGPRILHVTELAESDARFCEVHPEVSFRAMNGGQALSHRKKSAAGAFERLEILHRHGIDLDELGEAAPLPLDDVLDAAAAAWSANRIASGTAKTIPDPPEVVDGLALAVWY
jgi:predicted RNase H-like nuclease